MQNTFLVILGVYPRSGHLQVTGQVVTFPITTRDYEKTPL